MLTTASPFPYQIASRLGLVGHVCQIGGGDGKGLLSALSGHKRPTFALKPVDEEAAGGSNDGGVASLFNPAASPAAAAGAKGTPGGRPPLLSRKSARYSTPTGFERPQRGVAVTVTVNPVDGRPSTVVKYHNRKGSGIQRLVRSPAEAQTDDDGDMP